jgi:hypothetical protein
MEEDLRLGLDEKPGERRVRALRGFGIGLGFVFLLFAFRAWRRDGAVHGWAVIAPLSWMTAVLYPHVFSTVYDPWMRVVRILARANQAILCAVLFYVVITPYAVLLRLLGVQPLSLTLREKDSYWEEHPPRDPAESARRPF